MLVATIFTYTEHYTEVGIAEATVGVGQECQESFLDSTVLSRQAESAEVRQTKKPYMYYLQHERPCCIGRYKLEPKARVCMSATTRTRML